MDGWLNMSKREMDAQRCRWIKDIGMHRCVDGREEEGWLGINGNTKMNEWTSWRTDSTWEDRWVKDRQMNRWAG